MPVIVEPNGETVRIARAVRGLSQRELGLIFQRIRRILPQAQKQMFLNNHDRTSCYGILIS